jgi:hypothetical protein
MHSKYCELFDRGWCFGVWLALLVGAPAVSAEEQAGKTIMARGAVSATAEQQSRALKRQSPVYRVDLVTTGADSSSQLRMMDGGLLSMQADTELAIRNYQFDQGRSESSVSMELLKGGLRTITGTLPQSGKIYQLDTPVATIGVRGTHYEAILQQGDLYLAGWDGIIDIKVTVPGVNAGFSLGPELPYRFAIVRANGEVEMLLGTPKIFAEQQSPILVDQSEFGGQFAQPTELESMQDWLTASKTLTMDASGLDFYDNRQLTASWDIQAMDTISRTGMATFDQLTGHSLSSTAGSLSDLSMSMDVDFDGAWVPSGQLSFTDAGGEWFAVFNGVFGAQSLELSVNFASHGNELADGSISALFINNATGVLGNLSLFELDNPSILLDGGFELSEQP